ncbi:hypothetical protein OG21DRAFT_1330608 [Imleria badia]|nr:hypothetical protein OG21DRAFT_1330608 [Imleria badia]
METPTSVNLTLPGLQTVYLNGPVTTWVVRPEGKNTYRLSVGRYPYTGVIDDKVTASIHTEQNVEWRATFQVRQQAYIIEPVNSDGRGWTVADHESANSEIVLRLIIMQPSEPPNFSTGQLFRFEKVE